MIQQYQPEEENLSADRIAAEISANRKRIDAKLATLAHTFSPQTLLHNASERVTAHSVDEVMDGVTRYYSKARTFMRRRPIGTALVALGLAAMLFEGMSRKKSADRRKQPPEPNYHI